MQLGLNDGSMVEIVSGLAEGEAVLEFIPGAPAQQSGEQFAGVGPSRRANDHGRTGVPCGRNPDVRLPNDQELHILRAWTWPSTPVTTRR